MENSSEIWSFVLAAYGNIGESKYVYFIIMLFWYLFICIANIVLIVVIYADRKLHEPMYILLCNLFVNEIAGSTSLYPLMLSQMFSDTHEVALPWCFLQMSYIYICASVEFCNLAAMAYDRYVAICHPLHYHVILNTERVFVIILVIWIYSFLNLVLSFSFTFRMKFCGNVINKVYCDFHLVIKHACSVSLFNSLSDMLFAFMTIVIPSAFITVSYMKILAVCLHTSKENKQKAVTTCTPQIVSLSNMFVGSLFTFAESRFPVIPIPDKVRIILSIYLLICQPIITPFIYGFKLTKIKDSCKEFVFDRNYKCMNI
ncbi:olfactory receptor 6M1-like [Halichoeres trimaculatus]|uniref:olfactory receptor 6M1-like n=1 Tax=Halichoeres trimaculatus TaxID=147232 RepID=UPI003D9DFAD0